MKGAPVGRESLDALRARSSRADYASMASLAHAAHEGGMRTAEVLRTCYGVEFPDEILVIAEAGPVTLDLRLDFTNQPWQLAVPLELGGPDPQPDALDQIERAVLARDPDLLALAWLLNSDAEHGGSVVCYRLEEMRAGRTTVFGIGVGLGPELEDGTVRLGESLLTVLDEYHVDIHRMLERQLRLPSNRGAGSVDREEVAEAWSSVEEVRELQRLVAARTR